MFKFIIFREAGTQTLSVKKVRVIEVIDNIIRIDFDGVKIDKKPNTLFDTRSAANKYIKNVLYKAN